MRWSRMPLSDASVETSADSDASVTRAESPAAAEAVLQRIEAETGLPVLRLPKEREYKVELKLPIAEAGRGAV